LYANQASKLLTEAEQADVINLISQNPKVGVLIPGSGGLRKLRIGLEGRGKRGGGRVIYWFHSTGFPAVLLWVLAKNAASDLTPDQAKRLKSLADGLKDGFGGRK
jgi:hypothetical protein